jgi:hypothetical protein
LADYPGNTFISGSGYFLNAAEVKSLVQRKREIRYDIIDDVSVGLMLEEHEVLPQFLTIVTPDQSITEIKKQIRESNAGHVRLQHFPLEKAQELWEHMALGQLWGVMPLRRESDRIYKIYFPLFDHIEAKSNEVRLTHEGLSQHPRVSLVDNPESADYLFFCNNHLVHHCPFHVQFTALKDKYKQKTVMLDYSDHSDYLFDQMDFSWKLYFKRSVVNRRKSQIEDYGDLPVLTTAYCVLDAVVNPPENHGADRSIAVACLFDDGVIDNPCHRRVRAPLLRFARKLNARYEFPMQIGVVSETGPVGRSGLNEQYKACLFDSKIILHANPDDWEGDCRTWEALCSGALVFIDRMCQPIENPLVDGEHCIFYDLTVEGQEELERKILYYLQHDDERERIGQQGREFVLARHRSIDRVNRIIDELEADEADIEEMNQLLELQGQQMIAQTEFSDDSCETLPDIILAVATGYTEVNEYSQFISTLRATGATCPVFIGIFDGPEYEPVKQYLLDNGINYFFVEPFEPIEKIVNGYRFELYRQWLGSLDFRYALLLDLRDSYFQLDPFADIEYAMQDCDLYLMSEFMYLTVGNHPNGLNYHLVEAPYGKQAADEIADKAIINCGAVLGNKTAIMCLLETVASLAIEQNYQFVDQGMFNYLAYNGKLDDCGRIKITRAGKSVVNNCGFTELDRLCENRPLTKEEEEEIDFIPRDEHGRLKLYRNDAGWVLDDSGDVSRVVHQYDRYLPEIGSFVDKLSRYQHPDNVYLPQYGAPYRAEKFILFDNTGLSSAAIQALVSKIQALPVHRKPLILQDGDLDQGFLFSYGVLYNDLLFEPEEFRQAFASNMLDPELLDSFCEKWGYEVIPAQGERDIVVTIATGYTQINQYSQFISTLRGTGATCPVFIGIYDGPEYEPVKKYLLDNAINYFFVEPIEPGVKIVNGYRFEQYRQWLGALDFRYALLMDFRDAYFQLDPFLDIEDAMCDCDLYLMSEFEFLTVGNHPNGMNYNWVAAAFGREAADNIADEVILNSGAILGNKSAMMSFLEKIAGVTREQDYEFADQGTLNYLGHHGKLDHCGRIKITRAGKSVVNNCGFTELDLLRENRPLSKEEEAKIDFIPRDEHGRLKLYRNDAGWVLDDNGEVSRVVHQYDRYVPEIGDFVDELSRYQHPDNVYLPQSGAPYRAEKFILFDHIGLSSSAIQALVSKIQALPVHHKPLILQDGDFDQGFLFSYGVLYNDLLLESKEFRQAFVSNSLDPGLFDSFCKKRGYKPIYVQEEELLSGFPGWVNPVVLRLQG